MSIMKSKGKGTPQKEKGNTKIVKAEGSRTPSWLRNLFSFIYELSLFNVLAVAIALLVVVSKEKLFSKDGFILALLLVLFLLLYSVQKKFKKEGN